MNWSPRNDVKVRDGTIYHVHCRATEYSATTESMATLQEVALEDFSAVPSGEPVRLRVLACKSCGAILAVVSVVRP
jgi:hypothetical protein